MSGAYPALATLTALEDRFQVSFTGLPVPNAGEVVYFVIVLDRTGTDAARLEMRFQDGEQTGYDIYDQTTNQRTDLDGQITIGDDGSVEAQFPFDPIASLAARTRVWDASVDVDHVQGFCPPDPDLWQFPRR